MAKSLPTDAAIRAMDGAALCRLAWHLRLAPEWAQWDDDWLTYGEIARPARVLHDVIESCSQPWRPDEDIDQASAVLRQMRASGWWTIAEGGHDAGEVSLEHGHWEADNYITFCCAWHPNGKETEPLAILRACVLARAHQQRAERSA